MNKRTFPSNFVWGTATSSFQIEGHHADQGRGPCIWQTFCEKDGVIADHSNGEIACNHIELVETDLDMIKSLGVDAYRFSISWPRIFPQGTGPINEKGVLFYKNLIKGLTDRGIKPYVTLNHWDLPQALQDQGGWENRDTCLAFDQYADFVANELSEGVVSITTHNEPWVMAILGYEQGIFAPGIKSRKSAYRAVHHLLLSHGMAVRTIKKRLPDMDVGIVLNLSPIEPLNDTPEDHARAYLDDGYICRMYMDPLIYGHYPKDVIEDLGDDAPPVQEGDLAIINTPIDFVGVNYYTRNYSTIGNPWDPIKQGKKVTAMGWEVYPKGLEELLCRLSKDYPDVPYLVTENGAAFDDVITQNGIQDMERTEYISDHIQAVSDAIAKGADVRGYFLWSFMDNFEWASGYTKRFGIVHVDFQTQERTLKDSAYWYQSFLKS